MPNADRSPNQVFVLMPSDPWSEWTMSGISRSLCMELRRRGALRGAADPNDVRPWSFKGPSALDRPYRVVRRLIAATGLAQSAPRRWVNEREGSIGRLLARLPAHSTVLYAFHSPEVDRTYDLRRFRLMDLSLKDACRTGSYGFTEIGDEEYRKLYDNQYRTIHASDGIVTLSSYAADSIARDFDYDRSKIYPIGCGAALSFSRSVDLSEERYRRAEVLFVGRDWLRKGGPLLLDAFDLVKHAVPHARLTIIGPDAHPAPQRQDVNFLGFLAKDKPNQAQALQDAFLRASVFCMPSVCETWGLVYTEAAMAGAPIAGTQEWALPDIVVNGHTGLLAAQRNPAALADAIVGVLSSPARAAAFARAAIDHVSERLSWSAVVDRLLYAIAPDRSALKEPRWLTGDVLRSASPSY